MGETCTGDYSESPVLSFPFLYGNHLFLKTPEMQLEEMMHLSTNMIGLKGVFDCLKMCTSYHVMTDISLHRAVF